MKFILALVILACAVAEFFIIRYDDRPRTCKAWVNGTPAPCTVERTQ